MNDITSIAEVLQNDGVIIDREIREIIVPYLRSLLTGTEYEGRMDVITQNAESSGENTIVVGVVSETDAINAYNGTIGTDINLDTIYFRHERDAKILMEINMPDNDALWMFCKFIIMNLIQDMALLTSRGVFKIAQHPVNEGISVKDVGARKIWTARLALTVRIHNAASMTTEIY